MIRKVNKAVIAFVVPNKGECNYATRRVHKDITEILGYRRFICKGDQEPALQTLKANVVSIMGEEAQIEQVITEQSLIGESQSNGDVENAAGRVQGQYRSMKSLGTTQLYFG